MHENEFVRGKGKFVLTEFQATPERTTRKFPLILTTGRILSQYNVGAQTRRTQNQVWHDEDIIELHPHDAENRGIEHGDMVSMQSRKGDTTMRCIVTDRMQPGVVFTTFHHPESGANVVTTDNSDWATNCPEYKVTAIQIRKVASDKGEWQQRFDAFAQQQDGLARQGFAEDSEQGSK
jgi:formate dehydrogenase major subunit